MQVKHLIEVAEGAGLDPVEWAPFARIANIYWDARLRGEPGISQEDVNPDDADVLIERFTYEPTGGRYIHPLIEEMLHASAPVKGTLEDSFETFWRLYPRKVAKAAARKVWNREVKTHDVAVKVIKALPRHISYYGWLENRDRLHFVPHAATWLGQRRWEDELAVEDKAIAVLAGVV